MSYGIWSDGVWGSNVWANGVWTETGLKIKISGTDRNSNLIDGSLNISCQLNSSHNASFTLYEKSYVSTKLAQIGNSIIINYNGERIFGGVIKVITEEQPYNSEIIYYNIEAYGYDSFFEKRIIAKVYENMLAGDIIKSMINEYFPSDGFTFNGVEDGPTIDKFIFNYISVSQALDEISENVGYQYHVTPLKDLHFSSRESHLAPFSINDSAKNCKTLSITDTYENYRNVQYIRAGSDETSPQIEKFNGDGSKITYVLSYQVSSTPTIDVNSISKTVGILGVDTGKDFYWNKVEKNIVQDPSVTPLSSSDVLTVTYIGLYPIMVLSEDDEEITSRSSIENSTGRYEDVQDDQNINNLQLALDKANGMLRRYGRISKIINIQTDKSGLESGQLININLTAHGINDDYLIESINITDEQGFGLRYSVRALSGEPFGGWSEFFKKLANNGRKYVIRENEVLILMRTFTENIKLTDSLSTSSASPDCEIGTAEIGFSEIC